MNKSGLTKVYPSFSVHPKAYFFPLFLPDNQLTAVPSTLEHHGPSYRCGPFPESDLDLRLSISRPYGDSLDLTALDPIITYKMGRIK